MIKTAHLSTPLPLSYLGPDLDEDCLPCVLYFALSMKESLSMPPFSTPVTTFLEHTQARVFSVDLPFHGEGLSSIDAIQKWMENLDVVDQFLDDLERSLQTLFSYLKPSKIGAMGLSRGGLIASHMAARFNEISHLLCFAPTTSLDKLKEFSDSPLLERLSLIPLAPLLAQKKIYTLIGNRDLRVSTDACYKWIRSLTEEAFLQNIKSPPIQLSLKPSIGYLGHGTSDESFKEGALWLSHEL